MSWIAGRPTDCGVLSMARTNLIALAPFALSIYFALAWMQSRTTPEPDDLLLLWGVCAFFISVVIFAKPNKQSDRMPRDRS